MCRGGCRGGSKELLGSPPLPTLGPSQGQGAGQGDNMPSLLVYLKHPELEVNSTSWLGPAFSFNITNKLLLINHYNLMNHHGICSSLHTKTSLCSAWLGYKQAPYKSLPVIFKQRNIISSLKYIGFLYSS